MFRTLHLSLFAGAALVGCTPEYNPVASTPAPIAQEPAFVGTVSAADPRAEEAGMEMLRAGGSATDAAIAVMLTLTVVEPQSSGIGGGGFYVRGTASGEVSTIDGRETAPAGATPEWFLDENGEPRSGRDVSPTGLAIGVPANIALAKLAHDKHGRLEWAQLFEPAIELANGFRMNQRLHDSLDGRAARAGIDPLLKATFYADDGLPKPVGTMIRRAELADSFERLAEQGPEAMYGQEAAEKLANSIRADAPDEPAITASDIMAYRAKHRDAVCGKYRGYRICGMGPPSSGGIAIIQMLSQLERFDLASLGPQSAEFWNLFIDSQRLAYSDRAAYLADPDFVDVPIAGLIDPAYLAQRSELLDPERALETVENGTPPGARLAGAIGGGPPEQGTSHFIAVDSSGNVVSYTSSVGGAFGAGLEFGGDYLGNQLTDFSFVPEQDGVPVVNRVEGGKRPRSSMAPTIVFDEEGAPILAIGGGGGPFIPVQSAKGIIGVLDFGLPMEEAFALPVLLAFPQGVFVEADTWLGDNVGALEAMGQGPIRVAPQPFGSVSVVAAMKTSDGWKVARDPHYKGRLVPPDGE